MLAQGRHLFVRDKRALGLGLELPGPFLESALLSLGHKGISLERVRLADGAHVLGQRACVVEHAAVAPEAPEGHWEVWGVRVLQVHVGAIGVEGGLDAGPGVWDGHELESHPDFCLKDTNVLPMCLTPVADFLVAELGVAQGLDPVFGLHVRPGQQGSFTGFVRVVRDLQVRDTRAPAPFLERVDKEAVFVPEPSDMLLFFEDKVQGLRDSL